MNRLQLFKSEEFERVWDTVGDHAGQLFDSYEDLRNGTPFDQAIDNKKHLGAHALTDMIEAPEGCNYEDLIQRNVSKDAASQTVIRRRREFLQLLIDSKFCIHTIEVPLDFNFTIQYLCRTNILWRDDEITPLHTVFENAIIVYMKKKKIFAT